MNGPQYHDMTKIYIFWLFWGWSCYIIRLVLSCHQVTHINNYIWNIEAIQINKGTLSLFNLQTQTDMVMYIPEQIALLSLVIYYSPSMSAIIHGDITRDSINPPFFPPPLSISTPQLMVLLLSLVYSTQSSPMITLCTWWCVVGFPVWCLIKVDGIVPYALYWS